jgi:hypothetical protein
MNLTTDMRAMAKTLCLLESVRLNLLGASAPAMIWPNLCTADAAGD